MASAWAILDQALQFPVEIIGLQLGHQAQDLHGYAYNRLKIQKNVKKLVDYYNEIKGGIK